MTLAGAPLGAPSWRFVSPGPCFRDSGGFYRPLARAFRPARPVTSSLKGRPFVVTADGDPEPPGAAVANRAAGATPILPADAGRTAGR